MNALSTKFLEVRLALSEVFENTIMGGLITFRIGNEVLEEWFERFEKYSPIFEKRF